MQSNLNKPRVALLSTLIATVFLTAACGGGNSEEEPTAGTNSSLETQQAVTPTSTDGTWTKRASEGGSFTLSTSTYVRYGSGTRWVGKWVSGTVRCTNTFFGTDPYYGVVKQCDTYTAATSTPTPTPTAGTAKLTWTVPAGSVSGYRVYYGTASRTYSQAMGGGTYSSTSNITLSGLPSGHTYYFAVTAVDAAGVESAYSNEASKVIP